MEQVTVEKVCVVAPTSLIVPVTEPLKVALAIVTCPSVFLSAEMVAHLSLWRKTQTPYVRLNMNK